MIIRAAEVNALRNRLTKCWDSSSGLTELTTYFEANPHLLLATYFDEYAPPGGLDGAVHRPCFRLPGGRWVALGALYRECLEFTTKSYLMRDAEAYARTGGNFGALFEPSDVAMTIPFDELLARLQHVVDVVPDGPQWITSPVLWTPESQSVQRVLLRDATESIIHAIWTERVDLRSVHWRQFEDVVAELLRAQGLDVSLVTERPQGGRDIIARGELIPGWEPLTIAVEVKQTALLGRPEVHMALHQNRFFPALLLVTAGRFTAGVFKEQRRDENQLRLFLKDGVALKDMIDLYVSRGRTEATSQ